MSRSTALLDANVLYPAPMRDLFLQLAQAGLYYARWSAEIHREWIDALLRNEPHRDRTALERTRDLMNDAVRDCLVTGYEGLIPSLSLPDPADRHVLAAAITGNCDTIVTRNLRDFPAVSLVRHGIEARHPDDFLRGHLERAPVLFCDAVRKLRARLKAPPLGVDDHLATLARQGLAATAAELRGFSATL